MKLQLEFKHLKNSPLNRRVLQDFFSSNDIQPALETFRYFKTRPFDVIANHIVTLGVFKSTCNSSQSNTMIAYGHLDQDSNNIVWLGVCVSPQHQGQGIGTQIIQKLLSIADCKGVDIYLSVDKTNIKAQKLYERAGFRRNLKYRSETLNGGNTKQTSKTCSNIILTRYYIL